MQLRPTWVEIDLSAIAGNVRLLLDNMAADTRLMAVVKADGYGHGAAQVARCALQNGASSLGVATVEEGVQLREAGIGAPILVLGAASRAAVADIVQHHLAQTVFDADIVHAIAAAAQKAGTAIPVHIKIDTGMGRIGVRDEAALLDVAEAVYAQPSLSLAGVFTHFATADGDLRYVDEQHTRFLPHVKALLRLEPHLAVHAANSAALLRCPETHHDMVRAGIALYVPPDLPDSVPEGMRPAMRWVTQAVHVKEIGEGEAVSYGSIFHAERPTRVMTIPVGYADGYHRAIGGQGHALVRGKRAPVIGRVCMDQAMLDVTDIPDAACGDEVILLGKQGNMEITAAQMGSWCGMIDYEVVLSPTGRVPRRYV